MNISRACRIFVLWGMLLLGGQIAVAETTYSFSIVPQQAASKTVKIWAPVLRYLSAQSGHKLRLKTYKSIPVFEQSLRDGEGDFSYMNPYHYTVFHQRQGYQALAKAKDKRIKGILVVQKDGPIQNMAQLNGAKLAFPSPAAFAAGLLIRAELRQRGVEFTPVYVRSHDSGYLNVSKGRFPASGGVVRTFKNMEARVRDQLRILHTTQGYAPHAIAAHPRVPVEVVADVQRALQGMDQNEKGRQLLQGLKITGWEIAADSDWDDVRALGLAALK